MQRTQDLRTEPVHHRLLASNVVHCKIFHHTWQLHLSYVTDGRWTEGSLTGIRVTYFISADFYFQITL